jgi:hypothetical protein
MTIRVTSSSIIGLTLIAGINVWLLTVIATDIVSHDNAVVERAGWAPNLSVLSTGLNNRKTIGAYSQILTRPIFFKSREPYKAPPPLPPAPLMASPPAIDPGFVLAGVMIKSDIKKAYMFSRGNADGTWASEGDNLIGWKVRSVSGTAVKLEQNGRVIEVLLYSNK